jgi:hypothetical protein
VNKQLLAACLAAVFLWNPAFASQTEVTAVSQTADGDLGYDDHTGGAGDTLTASAASIGSTDVATAGAFYAPGLLTTSADIAANAFGSSVALASFSDSFVNAGAVSLSLDFSSQDLTSGSGDASTTLFVSLVSDGVTLFSDYVQGPWQFSYSPTAGTTSVFDLTLSSEVSADFVSDGAGNASSFGLVTFTSPVPEAPIWLLLSLGAVPLVFMRRQARREPLAA